jgi:cytochrome c oxidase subunit 2
MKIFKRLSYCALGLVLTACSHNPSILLDAAGPKAKDVRNLFWFIAGVEGVIFVLVLGVLFWGILRRHNTPAMDPLEPSAESEKPLIKVVGLAIALTIVTLTIFVGASYAVDRSHSDFDRYADVEIMVTAHQWWWELRYLGFPPSEIFTTANEIHVPVGKKIRFILKSSDVIHSLWFPNISGKQDIIPGQERDMFIEVDKEGVWQGRCGEFCGLQHAFMLLTLVAEPKEKYESWRKAQLLPAAEPQTDQQKHGRDVFNNGACTMCHAMRTADAMNQSDNAPDLTHLKSRATIGAGAAPNTKGYLGGWILDPHGIKPGVHMPTILQEPRDFQALLSYLETLK